MILKRNFAPRKVATYVWRQLVVALVWSAAVCIGYVPLGLTAISVPSAEASNKTPAPYSAKPICRRSWSPRTAIYGKMPCVG